MTATLSETKWPVSGRWTDIALQAGLGLFRNVQGSPAKNYVVESIGGGCAFIDYNRDGLPDILLVRGSTLEKLKLGGSPVISLFENRGGGKFQDVSQKALLTAAGWGMGVVVADYDNDGWSDFFVTGLGRNYLFHNQHNGTFSERALEAGLARSGSLSTGAAFGDLDGDGDLDLYVPGYVEVDLKNMPRRGSGVHCIYKGVPVFCGPRGLPAAVDSLYRNDGNGHFTDVSRESGIRDVPPFFGLQAVIVDFDQDGLPDIFVANDSTPNFLFQNAGGFRFRESGLQAGVAVNMDGRAQASMGVDVADYDGDGFLDLVVTSFSEDTNTLYRNLGRGAFEDASWSSRIGPPSWLSLSWGVKFLDYDNDGWPDLFVTNGHVYPEADRFGGGSTYRQRPLLHHNLGNGTFEEVAAQSPALSIKGTGRGLATGDFDNDGDLDLLVNHQDGAPQLLRNDSPPNQHWLQISLQGRASNRDAVGARVTLRAGGRKQTAVRLAGDGYMSSSDARLHFGLGPAERADEVVILWPSGKLHKLNALVADRILDVSEP